MSAPRPIPWLSDPKLRCNKHVPASLLFTQRWVGGPHGALLVVGLTDAGERPAVVKTLDVYGAGAAAAMQEEVAYLSRSATLDWSDPSLDSPTPSRTEPSADAASRIRQVKRCVLCVGGGVGGGGGEEKGGKGGGEGGGRRGRKGAE